MKRNDNFRDNLDFLSDIYKHHWDVFLKGFIIFLISCSILTGFATSENSSLETKYFVSAALIIASLIAIKGISIAISFLTDISKKMDSLCDKLGYKNIDSESIKHILKLLRYICIFIGSCGLIYLTYICIKDNYSTNILTCTQSRWLQDNDIDTSAIIININKTNEHGQTPLILATIEGNKNIVKTLISICADINIKDNNGYTALAHAKNTKEKDIIKLLKEAKFNNKKQP